MNNFAVYVPSVVLTRTTRIKRNASPGGKNRMILVFELTTVDEMRLSVCVFVLVTFVLRRLYCVQLVPSLETSTVNDPLPVEIADAMN